MQEEENVMFHSFYAINYLDMAVIYTLLSNPEMKDDGALVIPFEFCRHLCPLRKSDSDIKKGEEGWSE